jgi:hypothetical protein
MTPADSNRSTSLYGDNRDGARRPRAMIDAPDGSYADRKGRSERYAIAGRLISNVNG